MRAEETRQDMPRGEEEQMTSESATDQENPTPDAPMFGRVPDGGTRAWLVAAGACFITFSALGFANSFGVFQEYYISHQLQHKSPDDIAWIGSLSTCLQFTAGAIAGPLFDRVGPWMLRPSAILFVFSIMMTSLCTQYWQFMLAQGVLLGLTTGFMLLPSLAAVSQYFDKKRAGALGLAISGSSIGGVVFPIALSKMLNQSSLGFGWSLRIVGFIMLPLLVFSCLAITARLPPRKATFFIGAAWTKPNYVFLVIATFFMFCGMFTPLFYIPSYAVTRGVNPTLASYLLAIVNATSTFGRIIPGILADKLGRVNMFAFGGVATAITIFCLNEPTTTAGLIVYSILFGFTSGTIISGASAAFSTCPRDLRDLGTYMGMGMGVGSLAALIGPPVNGALVKNYGGFFEVAMFSGAMCLAGSFFALAAKLASPKGILARS
ncbi:MFS general substrate transporter [Pleurostoma richardsiae]|uniref:MFS general substrate transporter n=1 Tax=Pleurostoma richardsiae TaxID=41990 RepID=A0AA38VE56_9PEZI|nr:MFS general substrate transporter [Pleurostoma richardsiae]